MPSAAAEHKTDRRIQADVLADLNRDWRFKPAELGVEVDRGVVTLSGTVSSFLKVGQAAELALGVPGVRDVANKLTVDFGAAGVRDDTRIARAVRDALEWDVAVPDERIESVVRDGVVTLKGAVLYWFERKAAGDAVARLAGVRGVNNHIVVAPAARSDPEIFDEIKEALRRRYPLERIDVTVVRGAVTLMGRVRSRGVRRDVENIAWTTAGVRDVASKIEPAE